MIYINKWSAALTHSNYNKIVGKYGYDKLNIISNQNNTSPTKLKASVFTLVIDECGSFNAKT